MYVKVSKQGDVVEVTSYSAKSNGCDSIKRLTADEYLVVESGEIREYRHDAETRADNVQTLRRTFKKLRALITTNCRVNANLRWVTLTYAQPDGKPMRDTKVLYADFQRWIRRVRTRWGSCEYIAVAEPQRSGSWHMHVILIFPDKAPFMANKEVAERWGKGFVSVKPVNDSVDNLGAYLTAYLTDVEVPADSKEGVEKVCADGKKKKFVKGARLAWYPNGMNIYRCSRGIEQPLEEWGTPEDEAEIAKTAQCTYAPEPVTVTIEGGGRVMIYKRFYNLRRTPTAQDVKNALDQIDLSTESLIRVAGGRGYVLSDDARVSRGAVVPRGDVPTLVAGTSLGGAVAPPVTLPLFQRT